MRLLWQSRPVFNRRAVEGVLGLPESFWNIPLLEVCEEMKLLWTALGSRPCWLQG